MQVQQFFFFFPDEEHTPSVSRRWRLDQQRFVKAGVVVWPVSAMESFLPGKDELMLRSPSLTKVNQLPLSDSPVKVQHNLEPKGPTYTDTVSPIDRIS